MAFFLPRPSRYTVGWESADAMEKDLAMRHGCVCGQGFKMSYSWWLNPILHLTHGCIPPYLGVSEDGAPPVMAIFWWENSEKKPVNSGKIHQNPVMFRYQTHSAAPDASSAAIFYISLHHGSQASLFAKRHGSFQFYRGSFAGAGFSCPGRTFGCTLGHPRIRWNSPPVAPPKKIKKE